MVDGPPASVLPSPPSWLAEQLIAQPVADVAGRWTKTVGDLDRHIVRAEKKGSDPRGIRRARNLSEVAKDLLGSLDKANVAVREHQGRVDSLEAQARGFRASLGHAIDALSRDRSGNGPTSKPLRRSESGIDEELAAARVPDAKRRETLVWESAAVKAEETKGAGGRRRPCVPNPEPSARSWTPRNEPARGRTGRSERGCSKGALSAVRRITGELVRTLADAANCV